MDLTNVLTHNPNTNVLSTILASDILPVALAYVKKFTKKSDAANIMRYFGSHLSIEDLAMDAAEKVIRANPLYLTKAYVRIAARCVLIDSLYKKNKLQHVETFSDNCEGEERYCRIEETVEGEIYDYMGSLEDFLESTMGTQELAVYEGLKSRKMYVEIAEDLGISLRTFERQVRDLKWKVTYLLKEEDPDT